MIKSQGWHAWNQMMQDVTFQADAKSGMADIRHWYDAEKTDGNGVCENDRRVLRILNKQIYENGVRDFRARRVEEGGEEKKSTFPNVFVRTRPLFVHEQERGEWECVSSSKSQDSVTLHEGTLKIKRGLGRINVLISRTWEGMRPVETNNEMYIAVQPLVERAISGGLSTLFMFGMTGSGKTYNMALVHARAPKDIFKDGSKATSVRFVAYELVGKGCFDLLHPEKKQVHIRVGQDGKSDVRGATEVVANTEEELQRLLEESGTRRESSATGANATSSRSHAVYQLSICNGNGGRLLLIDLAGNEGSVEVHHHSKERMKETAAINASLSTLKRCLEAKARGDQHVPFRESILTRVLRDGLVANSESITTSLLACVSPACSHFELSLGTLSSAAMLMKNAKKEIVHEEVVKVVPVFKGGPKKWSEEQLQIWCEDSGFEELNTSGLTGAALMKMSLLRLSQLCSDKADKDLATRVFKALREASKAAATKDLENRRKFKEKPNVDVSSRCFAKIAPVQPIVVETARID